MKHNNINSRDNQLRGGINQEIGSITPFIITLDHGIIPTLSNFAREDDTVQSQIMDSPSPYNNQAVAKDSEN